MNIDPTTCSPKLRERIAKAEQSNATNYRDQANAARHCATEKAACAERVSAVVRAIGEHPPSRPLDRHLAPRQSSKKSVVAVRVLIVSYRARLTDDDNSDSGQHKALRDAIASTLGIDDGDKRIKFSYDQIQTSGVTGTHVVISRL